MDIHHRAAPQTWYSIKRALPTRWLSPHQANPLSAQRTIRPMPYIPACMKDHQAPSCVPGILVWSVNSEVPKVMPPRSAANTRISQFEGTCSIHRPSYLPYWAPVAQTLLSVKLMRHSSLAFPYCTPYTPSLHHFEPTQLNQYPTACASFPPPLKHSTRDQHPRHSGPSF